ncbi:hypothetical protein [Sphaerisporangium fuscum]|uniref:hypothetical protein n=1 Tax=Sphaerisporangium fuscum TaxID=2835868 RepID=UPI001BDD571C|nr:hypothetical protein [Sphaerisporangium fuscum]
MSSAPKSNKSLVQELFSVVSALASAVSSGTKGNPTGPGPVVDMRGKRHTITPPRRHR